MGDFVDIGGTLDDRARPCGAHEVVGFFTNAAPGRLGCISHQRGHAVGQCGAGQHCVHGYPGASQALGQAMGYRQVGSLGDAVVDHVGRDGDARLRGDEQDPPPTVLHHARGIEAGQAHAAQHVGVVEPRPLAVGHFEEVDIVVDAQVVDQDVGPWVGGEQGFGTGGGAQVGNHAVDLPTAALFAQFGQGGIQRLLAAAGNDYVSVGAGQAAGDSQANTAGRAADDGGASAEVDVHGMAPVG